MSAKVTIEATTGSETIEWGLAKVAMFVHSRGEEEFISKSSVAKRIGPPGYVEAVPGLPVDLAGRWFTASYEMPEGTLLKLYMRCKKAKFGNVADTGMLILRARANAPLTQVSIPLSGHRMTALKVAKITGRFDVIPLKVAKGRYGFVPPEHEKLQQYSEQSVEQVCSIKELAEGVKVDERVREVAMEEKGVTKKVITVRKLRKLEI